MGAGQGRVASSKTVARRELRTAITIATVVGLILVGIFSGLNHLGHKYIRAMPTEDCSKNILIMEVPDSELCCSNLAQESQWACVASYDTVNKIISSLWSFVLPLAPLVATVISETFWRREFNVAMNAASLLRLGIYCIMMLYRMMVLYFFADFIENTIVQSTDPTTDDCWYADYIQSQRCKDSFDFSDHIVLYLGCYVMPIVIELSYISVILNTQPQRIGLTVESSMTVKLFKYILPILVCAGLLFLIFRGIVFTAMFFHTPYENIVAFSIALVGLIIPLYVLAGSDLWIAAIFGTSKVAKKTKS